MRSLSRVVVIAALAVSLSPATAQADTSSTLTVVGTSDVSDSNLVQSVIKPGFEAAYPQYTLNYVSKGTGAAISYAEAGTASALIVHAASLENQFVDQGYSAEKYGRAIFYGDYVLVGPASDPAGIEANAPHDIVSAFQRIAAAGAHGTANFVSRGGTPGTTVQEHAIWALSTGSTLCAVSAANGGGSSPSTASGDCPSSISYPSWYHATGQTQAPNIENGDTCNYTGKGCYVFTDRGTFDYLQSTGAINDLHIVTRTNAADATGGPYLLINSFHAYAVNPAKFSGDVAAGINQPAATALLTWLTSPAGQTAVNGYLASGGEPPFLPDAAPQLQTVPLPKTLQANRSFAIGGTLKNLAPGTPPLAGREVKVFRTLAGSTTRVLLTTMTTDPDGRYYDVISPSSTASYTLETDGTSQIENASLAPVFGDLLQPSRLDLGTVEVVGNPGAPSLRATGTDVRVVSRLAPLVTSPRGLVRIYVGLPGAMLHQLTARYIAPGQTTLATHITLTAGHRWNVQVVYESTGDQFARGRSEVRSVAVR